MRTVIIIQARMTSTRLPGKVLREVLGKPLLGYQVERLARCRRSDGILVATTVNETDRPILDFCAARGLPAYRGPEEDVLARFHGAATEAGADIVVRVTSDCPLIDPGIVDSVIARLQEDAGLDYVSNVLERTYPRGLDCEAFTFRSLDIAFREAVSKAEREHVTPFLYGHPERFRLAGIRHGSDLSRHRWTVDTPEDFELIRRMLEELYPANPTFGLEECLAVLERHPDWAAINAQIEQKKTFY